jgi:hypothetical protein
MKISKLRKKLNNNSWCKTKYERYIELLHKNDNEERFSTPFFLGYAKSNYVMPKIINEHNRLMRKIKQIEMYGNCGFLDGNYYIISEKENCYQYKK